MAGTGHTRLCWRQRGTLKTRSIGTEIFYTVGLTETSSNDAGNIGKSRKMEPDYGVDIGNRDD